MADNTLRNAVIKLAHTNAKLRPHLLPILKDACECDQEAPMMGKFEEGKPADPTQHMSEEQKKEWWAHHEKNKDKFKTAKEPAKLKGKKLENEIDKLFREMGDRVEFNIMDLGKLFKDVESAYTGGGDMREAMEKAIAKYRRN